MRIRCPSHLAFFLLFVPAIAWGLFTGNDQFDRDSLNNEILIDREYFTNLMAYAPFWQPLPAAPEARSFIRNTEGSLTAKRFLIQREARMRGMISERSFWGYQLRQYEDLEETFFYQFFEGQAHLSGPFSVRVFGQPTGKKQDSDLGAGLVLDTPAGMLTLEGTSVDFNFNSRNLSDERDRRDLWNVRAKVQTPPQGTSWQGEAFWEWDSPVEREYPDDNEVFGHRYTGAQGAVKAGRWLLKTSWKKEHRHLLRLSTNALLQDFRRQVWLGDAGWFLKQGEKPVQLGVRVQRRSADFLDHTPSMASEARSRWEYNPYVTADWGMGEKCVWETGLFGAIGRDPKTYAEAKLKTALRIDFTSDVSLLLNPTWDVDRFFTHRTFDGGNIQFQARIP